MSHFESWVSLWELTTVGLHSRECNAPPVPPAPLCRGINACDAAVAPHPVTLAASPSARSRAVPRAAERGNAWRNPHRRALPPPRAERVDWCRVCVPCCIGASEPTAAMWWPGWRSRWRPSVPGVEAKVPPYLRGPSIHETNFPKFENGSQRDCGLFFPLRRRNAWRCLFAFATRHKTVDFPKRTCHNGVVRCAGRSASSLPLFPPAVNTKV